MAWNDIYPIRHSLWAVKTPKSRRALERWASAAAYWINVHEARGYFGAGLVAADFDRNREYTGALIHQIFTTGKITPIGDLFAEEHPFKPPSQHSPDEKHERGKRWT